MSLYFIITLSLLFFFSGLIVAILFSYFGYRFSGNGNNFDGRRVIRSRRKGKYIFNNFTARIFFSDYDRRRRLKILNGESPLTTEKYSFTKTKVFDN